MATTNILITPSLNSTTVDPKIQFIGTGNAAASAISLRVASDGSLSFEGSAGQLLSITNSMSGTIFAANDVSGIPSIEVLDTGLVKLNEFSGNLQIGGSTNLTNQVSLKGTTEASSVTTGALTVAGGVSLAKNLYAGGFLGISNGTTAAGYFGYGPSLSSGAATVDSALRWDGTAGKLLFSYGASTVGYITSAGALNVNSTITAASGSYAANFYSTPVASSGYGLWNSAPLTYGMLMSASTDVTYGGRISGETTSDYNMYLTMNGGTNRGFVFRNSYATPLFAINGDGVRSNVPILFSNSAAVSAAGTVQGDATVLTASTNNVTTVAASSGVRLPTTAAGLRIVVRNGGANALKVYPSGSTTINAGGAGVAYSLDVGAMIEFIAMSATNWYTLNGTYV